jgi:hypothetical protein
MDNKKYYHELTDKEYIEEIESQDVTYGDIVNRYKQPDWCTHPDALLGCLGCWTLVFSRKLINPERCKECECFKNLSGWTQDLPEHESNYWFIVIRLEQTNTNYILLL